MTVVAVTRNFDRNFGKSEHRNVDEIRLKVSQNFDFIEIKKSKGIVSRDFVVCFLVPFDRSHISKHQERVLLLLKVRFRIEFFDFRVRP
jgi:hypothetical protein